MRLPPGYEDLLGEFAKRFPLLFWGLNFAAMVGAFATGLTFSEVWLGRLLPVSPGVRLLGYFAGAALSAWQTQWRYSRRNGGQSAGGARVESPPPAV